MRIRPVKRHVFVAATFLGLVILLLSGCGAMAASAAVFQDNPLPWATTGAPQQPPATIPVYPGARFVQTEHATFGKRPGQAWVYTVSGTTLTLADVTSFYEQQMPAHGWKEVGSVVPTTATGTYNATVLVYHMRPQQQPTPTPSPRPAHHGELALIAAGVNSQANPHEIGFVITLVR